jgi:quercetin dioxygenase-like cupin family protein
MKKLSSFRFLPPFNLKILTVAFILLSPNALAFDKSAAIKVTPLLKTTTSWDGKTIEFPDGDAQITSLIVEIAPGGETGWHEHPVPSFGMLLQGTLEITSESGQSKRLQAGEALVEVVNTLHNGKNVGKEPVKILVFYAGSTDKLLTVAHPEFTPSKSESAAK